MPPFLAGKVFCTIRMQRMGIGGETPPLRLKTGNRVLAPLCFFKINKLASFVDWWRDFKNIFKNNSHFLLDKLASVC